jgi:manganese-dependent inorganic pyrophosphatase
MIVTSHESAGRTDSPVSSVERLLLTGSAKSQRWVVTPYHWPDLDGIACAIALEEFLRRLGYRNVTAMIWETPQIEAGWALNELGISIPPLRLSGDESIILVDASDAADVPSFVNLAQIQAIVDHRQFARLEDFPGSVAHIELVGAAATLITEYFQHQGFIPSLTSATALYAGIASNTMNFKATSTTSRDVAAARWLLETAVGAETFVRRMFIAKSDFAALDMLTVIGRDLASKARHMCGNATAIAQLEVIGAEAILRTRLDEILNALADLKAARQADRIILLTMDLDQGTTYFVCPDRQDLELLTPVLDLTDRGGFFGVDYLITRKELAARLLA